MITGHDYETVIAEFPRRDGVLRIRCRRFNGHHFVDVRLFVDGAPTPKGISIKLDEAADVAAAINRGLTKCLAAEMDHVAHGRPA